MNTIKEKRMLLEVLETLMDSIETMERDTKQEWACVGKETEQARNWKTDELEWEDEEKTIPHFKNKYEYVEKEILTEDDTIKLRAIDKVKSALEKLI